MPTRFVYVIDDDRAMLDSMAFLLDSLGFSSLLFSDAGDFLAKSDALAPGCILTDLRMPGMTGCALYAALRDRSIHWPVILMTSETGPDLAARASARGFADFLSKPIDTAALVNALDVGFAAFRG